MKKKLPLLGLILAFSGCYTEWGADQSAFIFEMELEFFASLRKNLSAFTHPLILGGLLGQVGLISCIFWSHPKKWILFCSLFLLGIIVLFFLLAGILSGNAKIIASTLPFWILAGITWKGHRKKLTKE